MIFGVGPGSSPRHVSSIWEMGGRPRARNIKTDILIGALLPMFLAKGKNGDPNEHHFGPPGPVHFLGRGPKGEDLDRRPKGEDLDILII